MQFLGMMSQPSSSPVKGLSLRGVEEVVALDVRLDSWSEDSDDVVDDICDGE